MLLCLAQHALAKSKEEDPLRGITAHGRAETERMARYFSGLEPRIDQIWHSEKLRACETAEIFAKFISATDRLQEKAFLAPFDDVALVEEAVTKAALSEEAVTKEAVPKAAFGGAAAALLIVGHMPHLSKLAAKLLGTEVIRFRNSGIVALEQTGPDWQLVWMFTPDIL